MMATEARGDPRLIAAILEWPPLLVAARIALASAYLLGGVVKLLDFPGAVAEQAHFGLEPASLWAVVTIVVELGGSALVIAGRLVWLGAGALGVLTAVAMLVANNFWALEGQARFAATNGFFEHAGLIGGLVLASLIAARRPDPMPPRPGARS